jgi:hypothetical protein
MATKQPDAVVEQTDAATESADTAAEQATAANTLGHYLVVRHAFGTYRKGDAIRDPDEIAAVLAGENAHFVHKVIG